MSRFSSVSLSVLSLLATVTLSGCAVGPDYVRPDLQLTESYREAPEGWKVASPQDATLKGEWWTLYGDEVLNTLMPQIAINNQNVAQYVSRYAQARALLTQSQADRLPSLGGTLASAQRSRNSSGSITNNVQVGTSLSWSVDLWGKLARTAQRREAQAEGSFADLANATLSAQSTLAQTYFQVRVLDKRIALYEETIAAYEKNAKIVNNRFAVGTALKSDLTQAQQSVSSAKASKEALVRQRATSEHAIAVLLGKAPVDFTLPVSDAPLPTIPRLTAPLPSTLLERRPDVASSERALAAANESIGIAIAGYYPDFTLSASAGYANDTFAHLISAPHLIWSLGANATATLFDFGKTRATVTEARAAYEEAVASYRQTVLTALQEVEDALIKSESLAKEATHTQETARLAEQTAKLKRAQYDEGMIDYTDVVTTETSSLSAKQSVLSLTSDALTTSVTLIEALGGGWDGLESHLPE